METFLTPDEILQLVTTGVCTLSDDLIVRICENIDQNLVENARINLVESAHIHLV